MTSRYFYALKPEIFTRDVTSLPFTILTANIRLLSIGVAMLCCIGVVRQENRCVHDLAFVPLECGGVRAINGARQCGGRGGGRDD